MSKSSSAANKSAEYVESVRNLNRMLRQMRNGQWMEASNEPVPVKILGKPSLEPNRSAKAK